VSAARSAAGEVALPRRGGSRRRSPAAAMVPAGRAARSAAEAVSTGAGRAAPGHGGDRGPRRLDAGRRSAASSFGERPSPARSSASAASVAESPAARGSAGGRLVQRLRGRHLRPEPVLAAQQPERPRLEAGAQRVASWSARRLEPESSAAPAATAPGEAAPRDELRARGEGRQPHTLGERRGEARPRLHRRSARGHRAAQVVVRVIVPAAARGQRTSGQQKGQSASHPPPIPAASAP
jgi:hypothetical protein